MILQAEQEYRLSRSIANSYDEIHMCPTSLMAAQQLLGIPKGQTAAWLNEVMAMECAKR